MNKQTIKLAINKILTILCFALPTGMVSTSAKTIPSTKLINPEWEFFDDFENYPDGQSLTSSNPFGAAGNTFASTEQSFSGTTSAKMQIYPENNGGWGSWGGIISINPTIPKGGEIWVRLAVYWPSSFEFSTTLIPI